MTGRGRLSPPVLGKTLGHPVFMEHDQKRGGIVALKVPDMETLSRTFAGFHCRLHLHSA